MRALKRTYSLTPETVQRFEQQVGTGERSTRVNEIMENWLLAKEQEEMRRLIIEGCEDMAETYLEMESEFHPLEEQVTRVFPA